MSYKGTFNRNYKKYIKWANKVKFKKKKQKSKLILEQSIELDLFLVMQNF
jgi:hypothetical protein